MSYITKDDLLLTVKELEKSINDRYKDILLDIYELKKYKERNETPNTEFKKIYNDTKLYHVIDYIDNYCKGKGYIIASVFHTEINNHFTEKGLPVMTPQQIKIILESLNYNSNKQINGNRTYNFP